jgi:rhodanese-related sulfurtransferase
LQEGLDPLVHYLHPDDHAGYYPGAHPLHVKITTCRRTGLLLGAQVVGWEGVDKRLDVFAAALYNRMKTEDLIHLDLIYAPPYSPARDAVLVAGAMGQTLYSGDWQAILPEQLYERMNGNSRPLIVDVRQPQECRRVGVIPGAVEIPLPDLRQRMDELNPSRETVVYCRQGVRGYIAARILAQHGFVDVKNLTGGILSWPYELIKEAQPSVENAPLYGQE